MHAGLSKLGQWVLGAALAAFVAFAHAQPGFSRHGGGGFARASAMHSMPAPRGGMPGGAYRGAVYGEHGAPGRGYAASPMRIAEQGDRRERGGARAPNQWQGQVQQQAPHREYAYGTPWGGYGGYRGNPITPVSAETRQVPHPPADSPVRAGSIREDVARYNEERATFRQFPRTGGEVPRPPMPSPYRN